MRPELPADKMRGARRRLLAAWLLLIGALACWWLSLLRWPPGAAHIIAGLVIVPLLLVLPPVLRGSRSACAGSTLLLLPYMGWGITEIVANPSTRPFAAATVLAVMTCFALLIHWLRVLRSG